MSNLAQFPQDFIWYSQEADRIVSEFDESGAEHNFSEVDKKKTLTFGLKGPELDFHYDVETGDFYLMSQHFTLKAMIEGEEARIAEVKDPITYKRAFARFDPMGGNQGGSIIAEYFFGYKTVLFTKKGRVHFKAIVSLPMFEDAIRLAVHVSPEEISTGGTVSLMIGEQPFESDEFNLAPQEAFDYQWTLALS